MGKLCKIVGPLASKSNVFIPSDVTQEDADRLIDLYNLTNGIGWTNKTGWLIDPVVENWYGVTVSGGRVAYVDLHSNNLVGNVSTWVLPTGLISLRIYGNAISGDVSSWVLPTPLINLYIYGTSLSGDVSGWVIPSGMIDIRIYGTSLSGNVSVWILPAPLTEFRAYNTLLSGDVSSWVLPSGLLTFYFGNTLISGTPIFTSNTNMTAFQMYDCGLSQANVDAILLAVYNRRAAFTYTAPSLSLGGTNSTPSGIYQDGDPPTTGKEYAYELINDPETEGFNTWTISYTA